MKNQSFVGKMEILGRDEILGWESQRRRRRRQIIQTLKTRAAAGDPRAIARLQKLQAELSAPVATSTSAPATNVPTLFAYPQTPQSTSYASSYTTPPTYAQQAYNPYVAPTVAYQSSYFDPSLSQNPYGPPPQPTIDSFQGDDLLGILLDSNLDPMQTRGSEFMMGTFVGDDELELAREGGQSEKDALRRRIGIKPGSKLAQLIQEHVRSSETRAIAADKKLPIEKKIDTSLLGDSCPELEIRAAAGDVTAQQKLALQKATGQCGEESSDRSNKKIAHKILKDSAASKSISRDSLKKAIWLYAGTPSTEIERTAIGKKMIAYLNNQQVILS